MADDISVSATDEKYTWGKVPFTWGNCRKLWSDVSRHAYTASSDTPIEIKEVDGRGFKRECLETIGMTDMAWRSYRSRHAENLRFSETYWDNILFHLHVLESFKTRDVAKKNTARGFVENFSASDKFWQNYMLMPFESFAATDKACKSNVAALADRFSLADKACKNINQLVEEYAAIGDKIANAGSHKLHEQIAFEDVCGRKFMALRGFNESVKLESFAKKTIGTLTSETVVFAEWHNANIQTPKFEDISAADNFNRKVLSFRNCEETASLADFTFKSIKANLLETAIVRDAYIKACEAVLSNLYIGKASLTSSDFEKLTNAPSGFGSFVDFKVGEYEYKDALVRVQIQSKMPQLSPTAADVVMHVDIPDTDDRGTAYISDTIEAAKIYFNKHYYTPPEVNVVVRGGSTGSGVVVPYIVSTDKEDSAGRYFEVELIDSSGERTTGTISWVSKGY